MYCLSMPNSYQNRLNAEYASPWLKLKDWRQKEEMDVIPEQTNDSNTPANRKKSDRPKQMSLRRGSPDLIQSFECCCSTVHHKGHLGST